MDKPTRSAIEKATQRARKLLEEDFAAQLDGTFDVARSGHIAPKAGAHLSVAQVNQRDRIVATLSHKCAAGASAVEAVTGYLRDAAFTALNRFAALKMLEARGLVRECVSKGEKSSGYIEFCGMAQGVGTLPDGAGYRLYLECVFDELSTEVKVLFDRRDTASVLWPKRTTFDDVLALLNAAELASVWNEDETIGWVYQYFNTGDERRQMRDESQAPRNSRELAVRNQFFTPRYVVQFLTDNTLGRTWYQMREGRTALAEQCAYLVRDEGITTRRDPKDPRDLKVLDPACGSGHFLLYAFDLLLVIYQEAWSDEAAAVSATTGRSLRDDYPDLAALHRAIPALVLRHNLYGVDIDPRAAQIAALALWLRAQRAFKDFGVAAAERARITRTHIVVAEPMPGDEAMVRGFADGLRPPFLRDLFVRMVDEMRLAGELGTLLRVEKAIAEALRKAREQFVAQQRGLTTGFLPGLAPVPRQGELDLTGIDDDRFFHEAEERIVEALRKFSESSAGVAGVRRKLFSGDATQGVALVDLARTKFDVVLMNPPFGDCVLPSKDEFEKTYPSSKNDLYAAFVERAIELSLSCGLIGAITSRSGFFLSSFRDWRENQLLGRTSPIAVADLGFGVLDAAMIETAAYCLNIGGGRSGIFFRLLGYADKGTALHKAVRLQIKDDTFERRFTSFSAIPGSPIAYSVSEKTIAVFRDQPTWQSARRSAHQGLATADNYRFVRAWWETPNTSGWKPLAKGATRVPFFGEISLLLRWDRDGAEMKAWAGSLYNNSHWSRIMMNAPLYFSPGITYSRRPHRRGWFQLLPPGVIFSTDSPLVISKSPNDSLHDCAVLNSSSYAQLLGILMARGTMGGQTLKYETGYVSAVPLPEFSSDKSSLFGAITLRGYKWAMAIDSALETSKFFVVPMRFLRYSPTQCRSELEAIVRVLDEETRVAYGLNEHDFPGNSILSSSDIPADAELAHEDSDTDIEEDGGDHDPKPVVSWAVGVAFGRFDVRLATGLRPLPPEPHPFASLPVSSPGMLTGDDGLPTVEPPPGYPIGFHANGVFVDDPGLAIDFAEGIRRVFRVVFGDDADERWTDAENLIDPKRRSLRAWLCESFFEYHIKRYSKSRRKAPIYWQLATPSASYSVWIYAHRITSDTFFRIQNDVVAKKLAHEESKLTSLMQAAGPTPDKNQRKELDAQETFVGELRAMLDEVKRVAPLWRPDLDDGVVLTMAPLWRLVPQHRAWQKELKTAWDALCAGTYDWAHVAMHLWPERVVPACMTDRSFAIAHGLEDALWVQGFDEKWQPRAALDETISLVVDHHVSRALQSALDGVRAFWRERYAGKGDRARDWWTSLEGGAHEDAKVAYALWPSRVMAKALTDPELARVHGIELDEVLPGAMGSRKGGRKKAPREPAPALSPTQLSMLAAFCCDLEGYASWEARWEALDAGAFDGRSPLALHVRTRDVVKRAAEDHAVAAAFGLERWFWIEMPGGPRRLRAPDDEVRDAIEARSSETVKAALASLMEAPQNGGTKRAKKGRGDA